MSRLVFAAWLVGMMMTRAAADPPRPTREPLHRVVDLDFGESSEVVFRDGTKARVRLVSASSALDPLRDAVRRAEVQLEVNGQTITLQSGNYHLPRTVAGIQVDCPIARAYMDNTDHDHWGLTKVVRIRLWPTGSPWVEPGTFVYPVRQRWFASMTQMANEPTYVDGVEDPSRRKIYYHAGLDIGGAERLVDVIAAAGGLVVSAGKARLPGYEDSPVDPRYDVVYLLDDRGWYYRYSHLQSIDPAIRPGATVAIGQKLGVLGKEGGSGGWSHLHFEIVARQPSGKWGTEEGYAFLWQAALREQRPAVIAVARPHCLAMAGEAVGLDGSRSWAESGRIARYEWTFTDGTTASGQRAHRVYKQPGEYSEVLKVTDDGGRVGYDFAVVQVLDREHPQPLPPAIHAAYAPTMGLHPGDPVMFKVRTFGTTDGRETWDFGDGTPPVETRSDGNVEEHARDGYAVVTHRFDRPGDYLPRVERTDGRGRKATARLFVRIEPAR
jgi:murein DD-endopeptidase MepM/ murein hydrolase activator NlpD